MCFRFCLISLQTAQLRYIIGAWSSNLLVIFFTFPFPINVRVKAKKSEIVNNLIADSLLAQCNTETAAAKKSEIVNNLIADSLLAQCNTETAALSYVYLSLCFSVSQLFQIYREDLAR